ARDIGARGGSSRPCARSSSRMPAPGPRPLLLLLAVAAGAAVAPAPTRAAAPIASPTGAAADERAPVGHDVRLRAAAKVSWARAPGHAAAAWARFADRAGPWQAVWDEATGVPLRLFGRGVPAPGT